MKIHTLVVNIGGRTERFHDLDDSDPSVATLMKLAKTPPRIGVTVIVSPDDEVNAALQLLIQEQPRPEVPEKIVATIEQVSALNKPVSDLELSTRDQRALERNFNRLWQVAAQTEKQLKRLPHIGAVTLAGIKKTLEEHGLTLNMDIDPVRGELLR